MTTLESIAEVVRGGFGRWYNPICGWLAAGRRQLKKVMYRADQRPLSRDLADPSQQELAKASRLLDLTEHRFHGLFSQPVTTAVPAPTQFLPHRIGVSPKLRLSLCRGGGLPVFLTTCGNVAVNVTPFKFLEIVFRTIPGISRQFPSLSACVLFNLGYHRRQLVRVRSIVGDCLRHDHLAIGIHSRLNVVSLNKPVVAFHDPALGIGEVGLISILGRSGLVVARPTRTAAFLPGSLLGRLRLRFG